MDVSGMGWIRASNRATGRGGGVCIVIDRSNDYDLECMQAVSGLTRPWLTETANPEF